MNQTKKEVNGYELAQDIYNNVQFWHEQVHVKARLLLLFQGAYIGGMAGFISFSKFQFISIGWHLLPGIIAVIFIYLSLNNLHSSWALGVDEFDKEKDEGSSGVDSHNNIWSLHVMAEKSTSSYISLFEKINNVTNDDRTNELLRYIRFFGEVTDKKIECVNSALWQAMISAVAFFFIMLLAK